MEIANYAKDMDVAIRELGSVFDMPVSVNWALLWSDILTFSRSLKIAKKSRSTHLKCYF